MIYSCCNEGRRAAVRASASLNGIDFLEVVDDPAAPYDQRQRTLHVHFLRPLTDGALKQGNLRIEGGERIRDVAVSADPTVGADAGNRVLVVQVDKPGDFSTYRLRVVQNAEHPQPPDWIDPQLAAVEFSFKVACPSDFDPKSVQACPPEAQQEPDINYLAKDYASFRQLMLDRLAMLLPEWQERNPADLGITLVELLAHVADYLSYQQDAVATEAYINTARRRISVRRHARLVGYQIHDGCNARALVQVRVRPDLNSISLQRETANHVTQLLTRVPGLAPVVSFASPAYPEALAAGAQVFELLHDATLFGAHNQMRFHTWGAYECCLPRGATRATLRGTYPNLQPGNVLILAEVRGPQTGSPQDADSARRHAVRLTRVSLTSDPLGGRFDTPPRDDPLPVTEIEWHAEDGLPFPLCISARNATEVYADVSVALGNIVLADHGRTLNDEPLEPAAVPRANPVLSKISSSSGRHCEADPQARITPPRYRPRLRHAPLTQAVAYEAAGRSGSATAVLRHSPADALSAIRLKVPDTGDYWQPEPDLLSSTRDDKAFVVEVEADGVAHLRFGDDRFGARPNPDTRFRATCRIGNGVAGNVGAETLAHLVTGDPALIAETSDGPIIGVSNPLPARGGCQAESIEQVRRRAPHAYRTLERAVSTDDYAELARRCRPDIQRAAATVRWTGSWHTVFVTVDRLGDQAVDASYRNGLRGSLERYRLAGYDLRVDGPRHVSLEIEMLIDVSPGYFASDVKAVLLRVFSNRTLADGRLGLFHPDNFSFGQPVLLSPLSAVAQKVDGVDSAQITRFQRQGAPSDEALRSGKLELGRLEIARLDNDPNFPERGVFNLVMRGGR